VDGEWVWQMRHWAWKPGRWLVPPAGARFSPWTSVRDRAGTLYVAAGSWRDASGHEIEEPPTLLPAGRSPQPPEPDAGLPPGLPSEDAGGTTTDGGGGNIGDASDLLELPEAGP
jgi:hypothetical protein